MSERVEIVYDAVREDFIAASEAFVRESPEWTDAARKYRRAQRRQVLIASPFIVVGASVVIGRNGESYIPGAVVGALFAGFLVFALPRLNTFEKMKKAQLADIRRADLSMYAGRTVVSMDERGVRVETPSRQVTLAWDVVTVSAVGTYIVVHHGAGGDGTIIPRRAFASEADAAAFLAQAKSWWEAGQLPPGERLARYLVDRDVGCPKCKYNLRGVVGEKCPECGHALSVEGLMAKA